MHSLYFLIPLSIVLVAFAGYVFMRAVDSGQFDDLERHGMDILEPDTTEGNDESAGR